MAKKTKEIQNDGAYMNMATGLGTNISKTTHNMVNFFERPFLTVKELSRMYEMDGVSAKIVNCIADDATASGFEIVGDTDGKIQAELNAIGFMDAVQKSAIYSRLYGGAVIIQRIADGRKLSEPPGTGDIVGFDVRSLALVVMDNTDFDNDRESPTYGELVRVRIQNGNDTVEVNPGRCIFVNGELVPDGESGTDAKTRFFGTSALNPIAGKLQALGVSFNAVEDALQEFKVCGYKLSDLRLMLSRPDGGEHAIQSRFAAINLGKSMCRAVVLDKDDEFFTQESSFGGIPEIILKIMQMVAASADIPMARLYGESASGLAATGEGDRAMYDQKVDAWRMRTIYKPMVKIVKEYTSRNGNTAMSDISFNPVSKPKASELVALYKTQAETMKTYFEMGVLTPDEIRRMVFEGGHSFSMDIK